MEQPVISSSPLEQAEINAELFIQLNEIRFQIYELDTIESIKIRLAANRILSTVPRPLLPSLLLLQETEAVTTSAHVVAGCRAIHVQHRAQDTVNPLSGRKFQLSNFYTEAASRIAKAGTDLAKHKQAAEELITMFHLESLKQYAFYVMFFVFNGLADFDRQDRLVQFTFQEVVEKALDFGSWSLFKLDYAGEMPLITASVEANLQAAERDFGLFEAFTRELAFEPTVTSEIQYDKTRISVKFQISTDIYELFNGLLLSNNIPFVSVGPFYKLIKSFKPPKSWALDYGEQESLLIMQVLNRHTEPEKNKIKPDPRNYSPVFILPVSISEGHLTNIEMEIESRLDDELREENLLERIFTAFPFQVNNCTFEQKRLEGDYLIPAPGTLDIPLFYDLVMNDPLVSQLMLINEAKRTFRVRNGIFILFRYNSHVDPKNFMSCNINIGLIDARLQARAPQLFGRPGVPYISVKLHNCPTAAEAQRFKNIVDKILEYYFENPAGRESRKQEILHDYALVFPDIKTRLAGFEIRVPKAPIRRTLLKDIDPDMFVSGYQRFCTHAPSVVEATSPEEFAKVQEEGYDIMVFPLYGEGPKRAYICKHSTHPFVGLKYNSLANRREYPYLPCCYPASQTRSTRRLRYQYEHQQEEEEEKEVEKRLRRAKVFISNKTLRRNVYGILPSLLDRFLKIIDSRSFPVQGERTPFTRQGSLRDKNSVLDALVKAIRNFWEDLDTEEDKTAYKNYIISRLPDRVLERAFTDYEELTPEGMANYLAEIRQKLVDILASNTTAQSTFNLELRALQDYIQRDTDYLDIKLFWRVLEEIFNLDIFLFQRNEDFPQGVWGTPAFLQEYLQYKRKLSKNSRWAFTVLLFETIGGEFDNLDYPQIELINYFSYKRDEQTSLDSVFIFSWFDPASRNKLLLSRLHECFNEIFAYDGHPNLPIVSIFSSKPIAQCADFYGKIRLLQFSNGLCVMTEPLPPMSREELAGSPGRVSVYPKCDFQPVSLEQARAFLKVEQVKAIVEVKVGDSLVGLQCKKLIAMEGVKTAVDFYIPLSPQKSPSSSPALTPMAPTFLSKTSLLDAFNHMARTARYIIEYVLWIFSAWHKASKGNPQAPNYLENFALEKFLVIQGHEYPRKIPRRLQADLEGITRQGRIIVASIEIRNRLIYALQIRLKQNEKDVLNYAGRVYIKNYYQDVTDFEMNNSSVILLGSQAVLRWIKSKLPHYLLHDRVQHPECPPREEAEDYKEQLAGCKLIETQELIIDPYFLRLEGAGSPDRDVIWLVQQASDLGNALHINKVWEDQGYNPGKGQERISSSVGFRYVAYNSPYEMVTEEVNGGGNYVVLQYKREQAIFTLALLRYSSP